MISNAEIPINKKTFRVNDTYNIKRVKIFLLSLLISVGFFVYKLFQSGGVVPLLSTLSVSFITFLTVFIGMIFIEDFQVNKRILLIHIMQIALFVFIEMMFVQTFFATALLRFYQAFFLVIVLFFIFVNTYLVLLMGNIFVVSEIKKLPLVAVAKTASYIFSILGVFYLVYSLASLGLPIVLFFFLYFCGALVITFFHLSHFTNEENRGSFKFLLWAVVFAVISVFVALATWTTSVELIAIIPAMVFFVFSGIAMYGLDPAAKKPAAIVYFIVLIIGFYIFFTIN